jgi:hypothetical protein
LLNFSPPKESSLIFSSVLTSITALHVGPEVSARSEDRS